jgi:nitrite reductase (NO-forming)
MLKKSLLVLCSSLLMTPVFSADVSAGKAVYERVCAACHLAGGEGLPGAFPPLAKSDFFKKATPAQLVKILDHGLTGEITVNGQKFNSAMPAQTLTDQEMTDVLNYVSVALNAGKPMLKVEQVAKLRAAK